MSAATGATRASLAANGFLDEHAALFHAFARTDAGARPHIGAALQASGELARKLMVAITATGSTPSTPGLRSAIRRVSACVVASLWESDALDRLDDPGLVEDFARGLRRLHELDAETWEVGDDDPTRHEAMALVMVTLLRVVSVYDFREDHSRLLNLLTSRVMAMADYYADTVEKRFGGDRARLMLTAARHLSVVMADAYDRAGRRTVDVLAGMSEADIRTWLKQHDPMAGILRSFDDMSATFVSTAMLFAQRTTR